MNKCDTVLFVQHAFSYIESTMTFKVKEYGEPSYRSLFILSKNCGKFFFDNMPKTFTITTKTSAIHLNVEMLKETSPVISQFIQDNPNSNNYMINISDDENILAKFEQLYHGQNVIFKEEDFPIIHIIAQKLQILNLPNYLKPRSLSSKVGSYDSDGYCPHKTNHLRPRKYFGSGVEIFQKFFIKFLTREEFQSFKITTNKKEYKCNIFSIYTSNVIRSILEKDSTIKEYVYSFEDENDEFQLICDFFNYKKIDLKKVNLDLLKRIAEDLQIDCILNCIDNYFEHCEQITKKIEDKQQTVDSIDQLFELLNGIRKSGIEKVKDSILQSRWCKSEDSVQELAAFIIQVVKPTFSIQKEIAELLIQLDKEANDSNQLHILIPFITRILMTSSWPLNNYSLQDQINKEKNANTVKIHLSNKCICSFIRILYKRGIIPKEEIEERLKDYDLSDNVLNAFFVPEIIKINPKNIDLISNLYRKQVRQLNYKSNQKISLGLYYKWPTFIKKYLPDKIELYEKMLDSLQPDNEITISIRNDDADELQSIVAKEGIDVNQYKVPYNIFDDFEEKQSLLNYSAFCGSIKCFNYLLSNNCNVDEMTFYFSICSCNKEIIKIVEEKAKAIKIEDFHDYKSKRFSHLNTLRFNNLNEEHIPVTYWYNFKKPKQSQKKHNIVPYKLVNDQCSIIYDKYNDENVQYQRCTEGGEVINFINCSCFLNLIAPTIVYHQNDLFDWIFENNYISNSKTSFLLDYLAVLSAKCGNAHSLMTLIDNGFLITKKVICICARVGFYTLTKLLLDLYNDKLLRSPKSLYSFRTFYDESIVYFGNLSIFKLFEDKCNQIEITKSVLHAINKNQTNVIHYIFDNLDRFDYLKYDNTFIFLALKISLKTKTDELFNFLFEEFKKMDPNFIVFDSLSILLMQACSYSNFFATKSLIDLILKENDKYDFTNEFFIAVSSRSMNICKYFIDKQLSVNFTSESYMMSLGSLDFDLFETIINKSDPNLRFLFNECINYAICAKNIKLIEFILKENPPESTELYESILTDDCEIVDLILKYNSKPSFVNQKIKGLTALCHAVKLKNIEIVKRLLRVPGIDVNIISNLSQTALLIAVSNNDIEVVDLLLDFYEKTNDKSLDNNFKLVMHYLLNAISECSNTHAKEWQMIKHFSLLKSFDFNSFIYNEFEDSPILCLACLNNKIDVVEALLKNENVDPNIEDLSSYNTPLIIAIKRKNIEIAKLLLKHPKTKINKRNVYNETALVSAVENEEKEIVDLLINDDRFVPQECLLNFAFIYSKDEICDQLYSLSSLDVNEAFSFHNRIFEKPTNALYFAVYINDVYKIDKIIKHPSFNIYKSDVLGAIFNSAKINNIIIFKKLIELDNFDVVNIKNEEQENLLSFACKNLSGDIVDEIIENNDQILDAFVQSYSSKRMPKIETKRYEGIKQLSFDVKNEKLIPKKCTVPEMMKKLIKYDKEHKHLIKFDQLLPNGKSFFTAIESYCWDVKSVSDLLIEQGVDVNMADKNGVYPLEHAIRISSFKLVESLVNSNKINYDSKLKGGLTYLHLAAGNKEKSIFSLLLELNVFDVNSIDEMGNTPLIEACKAKCIDNVDLLFKQDKLDYTHCNNDGKDAIDVIIDLKNDEKELIKKSKEKFHDKLVSVIDEMLNSNE